MKRCLVFGVWCLVFGVTCFVFGEDKAPAPNTKHQTPNTKDDVHDVVFLGEARPVLIRMHVRVDGKPVRAASEEFMKYLFAYLDVNGDGALDKDEAARAPTADQILGGVLAGIAGGGGRGGMMGGTTAASPADALDADKNGKVTPAEVATYYRENGLAPFQVQIETTQANPLGPAAAFLGGPRPEPSVDAVSKAVFTLLDADKDGKLTKEELSAAPESMLRFDEDEDEIVTSRELVPNTTSGGGLATAMQMMNQQTAANPTAGNRTLVPVLTPGQAPAVLPRYLRERYGPKGDKAGESRLGRKELGLDEATFNHLDADGDGVLDGEELKGFVKRAPDLELAMRPGAGTAVEVMGERSSPLAEKVKARDGLALLDLGVTRLDLRTGGEDRPDVVGGLVRQQYVAQLKQADADGNGFVEEKEASKNNLLRRLFKPLDRDNDGKVSEKELNDYLDRAAELQKRATAACVTLVLSDQSRGLFDLLDTRRDARLGLRALRTAPKLLEQLDRDGKGYITKTDVPRSYGLTLRRGGMERNALGGAAAFLALYDRAGSYESEKPQGGGPAWFLKMDRNRDGDVSPREFVFAKEKFRKLDADGDGLISADEATKGDALLREAD